MDTKKEGLAAAGRTPLKGRMNLFLHLCLFIWIACTLPYFHYAIFAMEISPLLPFISIRAHPGAEWIIPHGAALFAVTALLALLVRRYLPRVLLLLAAAIALVGIMQGPGWAFIWTIITAQFVLYPLATYYVSGVIVSRLSKCGGRVKLAACGMLILLGLFLINQPLYRYIGDIGGGGELSFHPLHWGQVR